MDVKQVIGKSKAGDKAAYSELVSHYGHRLVGVLYKVLGNLEDARDVAQETFVRAYLNLNRYDMERPFEPWLYRIGRNLAINHLKRAGREGERMREAWDSPDIHPMKSETKSPFEDVIECERQYNVNKVLMLLRPEFREVLTLRYMAKLEYEEIAQRMGIPVGTVKTWLNRSKEQFRRHAEGTGLF